MKELVKEYEELSRDELFNIIKLREDVFIVEQGCPFHELDEKDKLCIHAFIVDEKDQLAAYSRIYKDESDRDAVIIGRVVVRQRGCGLGKDVMDLAMRVAKEKYHAKKINLCGQVAVRGFYERLGFIACSEEYMHEGRMHVNMEYVL